MGEMSLESLRISYGIPRSISLEKTGENDKPSHLPPSMHPDFFTHGVRLPFHPFLKYMLSNFKCAPTQLSPIVWRAMIGMYIFWKQKNLPGPTFQQFQFFYQVMVIPNPNWGPPIKVWYYVRTWSKLPPLIIQKKSSKGLRKIYGFLLMETRSLGNL